MTYATPNNLTGIGGIFNYVNTISGNWFMTLMLVVIAVIVFATSRRLGYRTSDSLFATFFLLFFIGTLFWAGGLVAGKMIIIFLSLFALAGLYSILDS